MAGTVLLIVTKFNEVYPVTVKKLNALSTNHFSLERYIEFEGSMLATVGFDLSPEDSIYLELAELENKLGQQSQDNIKLAVQNPAIAFRLGSPALLSAIESISIGGLIERKNESRMSIEGAELRQELQRLRSRSPCFNRMVSPSRA